MIVWGALIYGTLRASKVKVIDLITEPDIEKACDDLIALFDCENGCPFDLLIGVADGGKFIAETIARKLDLPLLIVKRQRPLTKKKSRIRNILKYFPRKILNFIRVIENTFYQLSLNRKHRKDKSNEIQILSNNASLLDTLPIKNVLLIDDAVDSGATILDVEKYFQSQNWNFKVAVITQTFNKPMINADYKLYDKTLIRFPWSSDCPNEKKS